MIVRRAEGGRLDQGPVDLLRASCAGSGRGAGRSAAGRRGWCGCRCSSRGRAGPTAPGRSLAAPRRQGFVRALGRVRPAGCTSTNQMKMSPTADWPASSPKKPGRTEPSTMPQRPGMSASGSVARPDADVAGARADDLDELARATPEPTAPRWASKAPTATGMPAGRPSFLAHAGVSPPADVRRCRSDHRGGRAGRRASGSSPARNSFGRQAAPVGVEHGLVAGGAAARA